MIRILTAKLLPYRSLHKFLALYVLSTVIALYATSSLTSIKVQGLDLPLQDLFTFPTAWITGAAIARWNVYVPAFFVVQIVSAELELKLVRAQILAGLERRDVIFGWTLQNVILALIGTVTCLVSIRLFGNVSTKVVESGLSTMLLSEAGLTLYCFIFLCFAVLAANVFLRPVPAMVILILGPILEEMVAYILDYYGYGAIRPYLPFTAMAEMVPLNMSGRTFVPTAPTTIAAVAYGAAAIGLAWARLARRDL